MKTTKQCHNFSFKQRSQTFLAQKRALSMERMKYA